ncbi:GNAT family N-acetyltransferase [Heyndrickxia camelliae]|uniref:GNAT family N-acetyltransferase n=1 Tax=Heyndrickxia camelliae TaxID=1707093 RepID=A0A2N3LDM6_9BACI|nr:GNAT family N-acetyltransferase [Heyndrickxia camelliae]PKR82728.1 GNAT family N-acetyltransferase [Heyndrickxia camelliae]
MQNIKFIKDYKAKDKLRSSFNELANHVFGISFEEWYQKGFWNERYIPYSYVLAEKVIANVSVNLLDFMVNGEKKSAIQIGTVMTHPDFRHQGLSGKLMRKVLEEYENKCDFIYLFANDTVLDYYPKFGFEVIEETQFFYDNLPSASNPTTLKILDGHDEMDLQFIYEFAKNRVPVSLTFGSTNSHSILMFYCLSVFQNNLYYLEEDNVILIFAEEDETLHIYELIAKEKCSVEKILHKIVPLGIKKIILHFTPDSENLLNVKKHPCKNGETLFVKSKGELSFPDAFKHPLLSQA